MFEVHVRRAVSNVFYQQLTRYYSKRSRGKKKKHLITPFYELFAFPNDFFQILRTLAFDTVPYNNNNNQYLYRAHIKKKSRGALRTSYLSRNPSAMGQHLLKLVKKLCQKLKELCQNVEGNDDDDDVMAVGESCSR